MQEVGYHLKIENKIYEYIKEYSQPPNFLKIPLWLYETMKEDLIKTMTNTVRIDEESGIVTYRGLIICPTISIKYYEEIEVF